MEDFVFQSPTRFILGKGAENTVGDEVKKFGDKVLLVHSGDQFIYNSGLYTRITASLKNAGIQVSELTGITPNPSLEPIYQGIEICKKEKIASLLAVGGGSVIDTAKTIALGTLYEGDVWDFFTGKTKVTDSLPVGAVMTLPATGSEGSNGAVISNEETKQKLDVMDDKIRPAFAIMNPEITYTLPPFQTACGAVDMLSHAMERYFTSSENTDLTDHLGEAVMKTIIKNAYIVMENGHDYDARAELMWAAILAHNGLTGTGRNQDWACHVMGAQLSAEYHSVHGATLSVLTPSWAKYVYKNNIKRFAKFAANVFSVDYDIDNLERTALEGIKRLLEFYRDLKMPMTLRELKIDSDEKFETMAKNATNGGTIGCIKPLSAKDVLEIYKMAR